jgi:pyrrolidone-carboxylate peptidase
MLQKTLDDGVKIRFRAENGHAVGDRWDLYARSGPDAFLNVDHYWEIDPGAAGAFDPASQRAGTRSMQKCGITLLPANETTFDYVVWPEALRPPTNNPNRTFGKPLRIFALGEVVPHDGKLIGFTAKDNNNFSYRELCFSKFSFRKADRLSPLEGQIDITAVEKITTPFSAHVRTTAGSFSAERVRVRVTPVGGAPCTFRHAGGSWKWDVDCDAVTLQAPKAARDKNGVEKDATGEQYDIVFSGSYTASASLKGLKIEVEILSDFRDVVIASVVHEIKVIVAAPLPQLAPLAPEPEPVPVSHVFTDFASLTKQTAERAFGPVVDSTDANSLTTRYRTTSLFQMPTDMPAYAVCSGSIALQRDPANNQTVNLILRPRNQPIVGFPPIRYFIYRGLKLDQFLKGISGPDAALIQPASTSPLVAEAWFDFLDLNAAATTMPSSAFGYDPAQSATASIDDVFFRIGGSQLPPATRGQLLGHFLGGHDFGFEIVLENGASAPTIGDLRSTVHEIKTAGATTPFALRVRKEEVLNFLDPAAFYGLHMHKDGEILIPGAPPHRGLGVYTNVVEKFANPNRLYIDIRSDNGSSLNFHGNYGTTNQVKLGDSLSSPVAIPYGNNGWPILIVDSAPLNTAINIRRVELELPIADNEKPALYVRHGSVPQPFTEVVANGAWTVGVDVAYPNDLASGPRKGVAWVLRLDYGRRDVATRTVPIPSGVLKTEKYLDNVFGPIDRASHWSGSQGLKWLLTQEDRYVDANMPLGWRQMMACGMAEQTGVTARVLFYAIATAREPTLPPRTFIPIRAVPEGASDKATFFAEPKLFGMFNLELDKIDDGGEVQTLELRQGAPGNYATLSALLLGLSKSEFDSLAALSSAGLNKEYGRTLRLDSRHKDTDSDGHTYIRYRVGVQGLKPADGSYATEFPSTPIFVYSVDQQFFASAAFAAAEPVPLQYARNFEEEKGTREWPVRERVIDAVDPGASSFTIRNVDWRTEVVPGESLKIGQSKNGGHDGQYTVASVSLVGQDTVIVLNGAALKNDQPLGRAFTLPQKVEDRFIDFDQQTAIPPTMRTLVDAFVSGLPGKVDDPTLRSHVDTVATILDRARQLASAVRARADDYDRCLYWARLRMGVALKDHPLCRKSASLRRELVKRFERLTRGYDIVFPPAAAGARKVVITGFDPFPVYEQLDVSNPSGAVALALHGETIQAAGNTAYVVSAIFPVRYRDFDAGVVEEFMNAILAGSAQVHTIITISQNGIFEYFDLERFAGRNRSGDPDNEFVSYPASKIGGTGYKEFYESNLPSKEMVPKPFPTTQRLFFDQSYKSATKTVVHPSTGLDNDNVPTVAVPDSDVTEGSGGAYLSNEIFYRTAKRRENLVSSTLTGHLHIPAPQYALMRIEDIIDEVRQLIARGLQAP